jgi:hypothetical protein
MLTDTKIYSWKEFKAEIDHLRQSAIGLSKFLFRGHASEKWSLETTLERSNHDESVLGYYQLALRIKSEVQAFSGREWPDAPDVPALTKMIGEYGAFSMEFQRDMPHYAYLAHLRHHGFPSPLLDWSSSPFVAAYFAFADRIDPASNVAIYAYRERGPQNMKTGGSNEPSIRQLGPYVAGPKRHFAQRSQYTVCTHWNEGSPCFWLTMRCAKRSTPKPSFNKT